MNNNLLLLVAGAFLLNSCGSKQIAEELHEGHDHSAFELSNLDSNAHACEDFYQFAIGGWLEENPVPSTESRWAVFNVLHKENETKLQAILDEIVNKEHKKGTDAQLIADLYKAANDSLAREKEGMAALEPYLAQANAITSIKELETILPLWSTLGANSPFGFYVSADGKNSSQNITHASQSGMSLPDKEYYLSEEEKYQTIRTKYKEHIAKVYDLLGLENGGVHAANALKMETEIARISWDRTKMRDPNLRYNKMTLQSFDASLENMEISKMLANFGINGIDTIIIGQPSYFTDLNDLLQSMPIETIKSYLNWSLIDAYAAAISNDLEIQNFAFYSTTLKGVKEMKPKNERVLNYVNGSLGQPLGKLFVEKHFPEESKEYIAEMIENLRKAYKNSIANLTWMSNETKGKAYEKLAAFTYKIGYPDKWKDYSKLDISPSKLLQNNINLRKHGLQFMLDKVGQPVDRDEWHMTPQTINAYYNPSNNEIVFPAAILQPPFFSPDFDAAINYGGIGGVIGHEFTHGFDDQGSKFDKEGNINNWWTEEDRAAFGKLTSKLSEQYSSYEVIDGMSIKGDMTLGENIADLGGVTLSFEALKMHLGENTPTPIDGFTWQQRFFLGWANVWKNSITDEELKNRLVTDYHSPGKYRVMGPLSNVPAFEEAFGGSCKNNTMIKPDSTKIKIW